MHCYTLGLYYEIFLVDWELQYQLKHPICCHLLLPSSSLIFNYLLMQLTYIMTEKKSTLVKQFYKLALLQEFDKRKSDINKSARTCKKKCYSYVTYSVKLLAIGIGDETFLSFGIRPSYPLNRRHKLSCS
jgi:hypothetical protein